MKYAWIARHKALWPVTLACEVLGVSASGYFEHCRRKDAGKPSQPGANKRISDEALLVHIKAIHAEVKQEYGWPKMCKELLARGIRVGKPPSGGLEHEAVYANQRCDGCFARGMVSPPARAGFDLSLGSWQSILQP